MLADLVAALDGNQDFQQDHGRLRADLIAYLRDGIKVLADPPVQRVLPYLIAQARSSDLVQAFRQLPGPTRDDGRASLRRAIDRGELPGHRRRDRSRPHHQPAAGARDLPGRRASGPVPGTARRRGPAGPRPHRRLIAAAHAGQLMPLTISSIMPSPSRR
jgi:hypothetical protein